MRRILGAGEAEAGVSIAGGKLRVVSSRDCSCCVLIAAGELRSGVERREMERGKVERAIMRICSTGEAGALL